MILWVWDHPGAPLEPLHGHGCSTLCLMLDPPPLEIHSFVEAGVFIGCRPVNSKWEQLTNGKDCSPKSHATLVMMRQRRSHDGDVGNCNEDSFGT